MGHSSPDTDNLRCTVHASIVRFWYRGSRLDVTRNAILAVEKFDGPESRGGERARVVRLHECDEARLKGSGVPTDAS